MKFVLISPKNRSIYNFRGDLLQTLVSLGYEVIAIGPNEEHKDKIDELGVQFKVIPLNKTGLNMIADIMYLFALKKMLVTEKPDITLGYTIKPVIYGSIAAKLARVKNITAMVTGVGYVFTSNTKKARLIRLFVSILYRISFMCADTVIFQNGDDLNEFVDLRLVRREKCRLVNGSGVNMEKFRPAGFPDRITFFMLARVMHSKGVREYLQAAQTVKTKYPEVRFMLLGAVENIQDSLSMNDIQPYIEVGTIEYFGETEDVTSFYYQSSVYVLPSYREGTPRTILEAMATGRPIITTDAPGCRETVIDGVNGFLIPVKNWELLAHKMEWFIENHEEIEKMGWESYRLCKEKYDVRKVNAEMLRHLSIK